MIDSTQDWLDEHWCEDEVEKEALLVEYIESELDEFSDRAVQTLIQHSAVDRKIVDNLRMTKDSLKGLCDVPVPDSESYYNNLQERILSSLDEVPQSERRPSQERLRASV